MARSKPRQRVAVDGSGGSLRQPLPGLGALRDRLPAATEVAAEASPPSSAPAAARGNPGAAAARAPASTVYSRAPRLIVRRERKGHGGKVATRVEGLVGSRLEIEAAMREIQRSLGCGATLEGGDVVVQGAHGERLAEFLAARGARKVTVGS